MTTRLEAAEGAGESLYTTPHGWGGSLVVGYQSIVRWRVRKDGQSRVSQDLFSFFMEGFHSRIGRLILLCPASLKESSLV